MSGDSKIATFQLLTGQIITVPMTAVSVLSNSPGELDIVRESFDLNIPADTHLKQVLDKTVVKQGRSSLKIDAKSNIYQHRLEPALDSARVEFSFCVRNDDVHAGCGEWYFEWEATKNQSPPLIVRIDSNRSVVVDRFAVDWDTQRQTVQLSEGWHSFVGLISADRIRFIIDEALLLDTPNSANRLSAIRIQSPDPKTKNVLWIDELQIRRTGNDRHQDWSRDYSCKLDTIVTANGDELYGKIDQVSDESVGIYTSDDRRVLAWAQFSSLAWHQPDMAVRQTSEPAFGIISEVALQPFTDRPDCESEHWIVTVTAVDSKHLVAVHPLVGELKLNWSDIRRIAPIFNGQLMLIEARSFHLGNSIRSDFRRHWPDGTELQIEFDLKTIPAGSPSISLEVAELEAASADAPPGSPYLRQLRAGNLVTEVRINDRRIDDLNRHVRFKARSNSPSRIRIEIPLDLLKPGKNRLQLHQKSLDNVGKEFDDCEVGGIWLEFKS